MSESKPEKVTGLPTNRSAISSTSSQGVQYLQSPKEVRNYISTYFSPAPDIVNETTSSIPNLINQVFSEKFANARPQHLGKITINSNMDSQNIAFKHADSKVVVMNCANGDFILGGFRWGEGEKFHGTQEESLAYTTCISSYLEEPYGDKVDGNRSKYPLGRYKYKISLTHNPSQINALYTQNVPCFALAANVQDTMLHRYKLIEKPFNINIFTIAGFDLRSSDSIRKEQVLFMKSEEFDWQKFKNDTKAKYDLFFQNALLNGNQIAIPGALSCGAFALSSNVDFTQRMSAEAFVESALEYEGFIHIEIPILNNKLIKIFTDALERKRHEVGLGIQNLLKKTAQFKDVQLNIRLFPLDRMQIDLNNDDPNALKLLENLTKYVPGVQLIDNKILIISRSQTFFVENYLRMLAPKNQMGATSFIASLIFENLPEKEKLIPSIQLTPDHLLLVTIGDKSSKYRGFQQIYGYLQSQGCSDYLIASFYHIHKKAIENIFFANPLTNMGFMSLIAEYHGTIALDILESMYKKVPKKWFDSSLQKPLQKLYCDCIIAILKKNPATSMNANFQKLVSDSPLMNKGVFFGNNEAEEIVGQWAGAQKKTIQPK